MTRGNIIDHPLKRAPAIRRNPHRGVRGNHQDRTLTPPSSARQKSRGIQKIPLKRSPAVRRGGDVRRAVERHLETGSITPPLSIDDNRHRNLVAQIENANFSPPVSAAIRHYDPRRSSLADQELKRLLGLEPLAPSEVMDHLEHYSGAKVPPGFRARVLAYYRQKIISENVARYYLEVVPRGDSWRLSSQGSRNGVLKAIYKESDGRDSQWKLKRTLGSGGFGSVILWEKQRKNGPPLRVATKDAHPYDIFADYCSEAHLTRRLNDLECKNVINVADWVFIPGQEWIDPSGVLVKSEDKHRICYEYAEYGDLWHLVAWYKNKKLLLPEAFLWHILYSVANALCFCRRGSNGSRIKPGWDQILHGDIKEENIFLTNPDPEQNRLYPCAKLGDFGMAYTIGLGEPEIQQFKSARPYGTDGYTAPEIERTKYEVEDQTPRLHNYKRPPHELHSPQADIWSLGATFRESLALAQQFFPIPLYFADMLGGGGTDSQDTAPGHDLYSKELLSLLTACMLEDPTQRIKTFDLYQQATKGMMLWRDRAYSEESDAIRKGTPWTCFRSKVLYTEEDRKVFKDNTDFRRQYMRSNLRPLEPLMRFVKRPSYQPTREKVHNNKVEIRVPVREGNSRRGNVVDKEKQKRAEQRNLAAKNRTGITKRTTGAVTGVRNFFGRLGLKSAKVW